MKTGLRRGGQAAVLALALASGWFWGGWYAAARDLEWARSMDSAPPTVEVLERTVRRVPFWGLAHLQLARARLGAGELAGAQASLAAAARTYHDYSLDAAWGWALEQQGRLAEALDHYRPGLAYHPSDPRLRERTVRVLVNLALQDSARAMGAAGGREYRGARFDLALLAQAAGRLAEAERAAGSDAGLQADVLAARGRLALLQGDLAAASGFLAERISLDPHGLDPLSVRWALEESNQAGRERDVLRRQLQLGPLAAGDARQLAFELEARAGEFSGDYGLAAYLLGLARLRAGDPDWRTALAEVPVGSPFWAESVRLLEGGLAASPLGAGGARQFFAAR